MAICDTRAPKIPQSLDAWFLRYVIGQTCTQTYIHKLIAIHRTGAGFDTKRSTSQVVTLTQDVHHQKSLSLPNAKARYVKYLRPRLTPTAVWQVEQESCAIAKMSVRCTIRQYAHGLLLESPFVPSCTDCWVVRAK